MLTYNLFLSFVKIKPATKYPWLVELVVPLAGASVNIGEEMRVIALNKNATGLGAPVAVKLNQKDWLNCCAETRPWGYGKQVPILNLT